MTVNFSTLIRNAVLDAFETAAGPSAKIELRTGAPAAADAAGGGTLLCIGTLPYDWLNNGASAAKTLLGIWSAVCTTGGTIGHYRLTSSAGVCFETGTYALAASDLNGSAVVVVPGQVVTITAKPYSIP